MVQIFRYKNLPLEDCWPGVNTVSNLPPGESLPGRNLIMVSEPTSRLLYARAAACFSIYLKVTPGDCRSRMQPVNTVFNPTYKEMSVKGAACLYSFKAYLTKPLVENADSL